MSFLLFLRGFLGVLIVFGTASYVVTQSLWTALVQTLICAVVIQVGYFVAVLFLVWRGGASRKGSNALSGNAVGPAAGDATPKGEAAPLQGVRRTPLP